MREAEESLSSDHASVSGRLRIDVATAFARGVLIPAMAEFQQRFPAICLELGCGDRPVDLIEQGVDCALRGGTIADQNLIARRIGTMYFVTCATSGYLEKHGRPKHPDDLASHLCVNYFSTLTGRPLPLDFEKDGVRIDVAPGGPLAVNDSSVYLDACLAGLGIAQLPFATARESVERGILELVLGEWLPDPLPLSVAYPLNRNLSNKVRVFVEWIAELFERDERLMLHSSLRSPVRSRVPPGSASGAANRLDPSPQASR